MDLLAPGHPQRAAWQEADRRILLDHKVEAVLQQAPTGELGWWLGLRVRHQADIPDTVIPVVVDDG